MCAALDTGSSFEGMGASREAQFSILAEGAFIGVISALVIMSKSFSLDGCLNNIYLQDWSDKATALILLLLAYFITVLLETCRVPADDPDTHLELTMIHEAMILDNSGSDLAIIHYTASLKMWMLFSFGTMMLMPVMENQFLALALQTLCVILCAALTGIIESVTARYRFLKVPQFIAGATALALMACVFIIIFQEVK